MMKNASCKLIGICSVALAASVLAGCGGQVGQKAPDWELKDTDGNRHAMSDFNGRVVLLDFWATWCGPCVAASPHIQSLAERFENRPVSVVGIHYNDNGNPAAYVRKHGYTFPVMVSGFDVAQEYNVSSIPTILIVDPDGIIVHRQTGFSPSDEEVIARKIEKTLESHTL